MSTSVLLKQDYQLPLSKLIQILNGNDNFNYLEIFGVDEECHPSITNAFIEQQRHRFHDLNGSDWGDEILHIN